MLKRFSIVLFALLFAAPCMATRVKYQMDCTLGKGTAHTQSANGSTVVLTPSNGMCHVSVLDAHQKSLFEYDSTGMAVFVGMGVTMGGSPNAIILADTGEGPQSHYKLFVVSLGERPRLLKTIDNQYGFWLQDDCGGKIRIWTADGAFQKDPDLADVYLHDVISPGVVLEIQEEKLIDATPECRPYFDKQIESLRLKLSEDDITRFHADRIGDTFHRAQVKGRILSIVFCYLYTGRETEAKQNLQRMWPSNDIDRLWQSIVKLRSEGVLSQIN
jgi:hypothetical protein